MTLWFGEPWPSAALRAPICADDAKRIPVPVGGTCYLCEELIDEDDRGTCDGSSVVANEVTGEPRPGSPLYSHHECGLRSVMGCYGHLVGMGHTHDAPYREDARRVMSWLEAHSL